MGKGVAAEAVRSDEHGFALGLDRGGDFSDPFILVGIVPAAEFDSLAMRESMFPQALPVGRAAVVKARDRQEFMADRRAVHDGFSFEGARGTAVTGEQLKTQLKIGREHV